VDEGDEEPGLRIEEGETAPVLMEEILARRAGDATWF